MENCEKQLCLEGKLRDDLVPLLPPVHFFPRFFGRKPYLDYLGSFEPDIKVVFGVFPGNKGVDRLQGMPGSPSVGLEWLLFVILPANR